MKTFILVIVAFLATGSLQAQSSLTTFIFVRHAEKVSDGSKMTDASKDPGLSEEGKNRAMRLAQLLSNQKLSAVYSTNYKRTRNTVDATANEHGVSITLYDKLNQVQLKEIASEHKEATVLVCGHSNTVPAMINALLGTEKFKQWDESDYGNLIIVTVSSSGETGVTSLRF